jgi:hypothetical protein
VLDPQARSDVVIPVRLPHGVDFAQVQADLSGRDMEVYFSPEAQARGYFFLAPIGHIDPLAVEVFVDALALSCRQAAPVGEHQRGGPRA